MNNKKVVIGITSIVAVFFVIIGVTYAYWLVTRTQTNQNVISTGCLDIAITGEKNDIKLTNQFPMSDEDGMKLVPFDLMVTNNCKTNVDFQINLETLGSEDNTIIPSAIKVALNDDIALLSEKGEATPTLSDAFTARKLITGTLGFADEASPLPPSRVYNLRLWIDANAPISEQNKTFRSKLSVTAGQGIFNPYKEGTLAYDILSNYGGASSITKVEDFDSVSTGLFKMSDDLGISYYFRGDVTNNYVKFGSWKENGVKYQLRDTGVKNVFNTLGECEANYIHQQYGVECLKIGGNVGDPIYWRILRINGDGTIRLIYDGTEPVSNGINHSATISSTTAYSQNDYDIKYLGYTYEDENGSHLDSALKELTDNWYENNLEQEYSKYIADGIFCNDKDAINYYDREGNKLDSTATNIDRIESVAYNRLVILKKPQLVCLNKNNRYTKSNSLGNGYLKYPIGSITADEIMLSGDTYLSSNLDYWTLTVAGYDRMGHVMTNKYRGAYMETSISRDSQNAIRPVINLKTDVKFTGNGRIDTNSPYEIVID